MDKILVGIIIAISVLLIVAILLQPSQKTGLIGDATDIEKRVKRGAELFLYRLTMFLIFLFIALSLVYGYIAK